MHRHQIQEPVKIPAVSHPVGYALSLSKLVDRKLAGRRMDDLLHYNGKEKHVLRRPDGYIRVYDMLQHLQWWNVDLTQFREFVEKQYPTLFEFTLQPDAHSPLDINLLWWIRKKSFIRKKNVDRAISRIYEPERLPYAIYKAPLSEWDDLKFNGIRPTVRKRKGLIVLSPRDFVEENTGSIGTFFEDMLRLTNPGDPALVNTSFIYISLDVKKAMGAGVDFYRSRQSNILSPGDRRGIIRPNLFKHVTEVNINKDSLT